MTFAVTSAVGSPAPALLALVAFVGALILVIVSAIGGAALGGILGALVAVPVAAAGLIIVNRVVVPRQEAR
ncbi:hypothetical protein B7R22_13820 [Subtercola boreus]|uniref:Major facilitator superfamily (MFS) profile domain-containing protein n=1 Tax=Subtercola boreus TaxID=120213 RepID=A0A3E0VUI3_9MICO|nr:hypothetical protein [Subtercola boreus]RFA13169.1 hypothetical protein B7R22_13820 [Subtercola boreus]